MSPDRRDQLPRDDLPGRDEVLETLRRLSVGGRIVKGKDISPHAVWLALRVHFGTMANARKAAGIAPLPRSRTWSQDRLVRELRRRHRRGARITSSALQEDGEKALLYAIYAYAGSMRRARLLAGIPEPRRPTRQGGEPWDEARVIEEILALRADGQSIAYSKVEPRLAIAARKLFGNWRAAVEAAGFDYATVRLVREPYTRDEIIGGLQRLAADRPRMKNHQLGNHMLGRAARKVFGSVAAGLEAAGLRGWPVRSYLPPMSRRDVIARVRARRAAGVPVYSAAVLADEPRLWRSGRAHWGRWRRVLAAAGVRNDAQPRRAWSGPAVLEALRDRQARGLSLRLFEVEPVLVQAAVRHFGSYRAAALKVGFDSGASRRPWTQRRVLDELRRRAGGGTRVTIAQAGPALYKAAYDLFGKYSEACRAAGLEVHTTVQPPRRRRHGRGRAKM